MQPGMGIMRSSNAPSFLGGRSSKYLTPARTFSRTTTLKAVARENEEQVIPVEMDKYKGVIIKDMEILADSEKEFDT